MLKRIVLSLTAVMFLLGAGTSFAASLNNSIFIENGETTKADVVSMFGEPDLISKDMAGRDKYIYDRKGATLYITFENDVVWVNHTDG